MPKAIAIVKGIEPERMLFEIEYPPYRDTATVYLSGRFHERQEIAGLKILNQALVNDAFVVSIEAQERTVSGGASLTILSFDEVSQRGSKRIPPHPGNIDAFDSSHAHSHHFA